MNADKTVLLMLFVLVAIAGSNFFRAVGFVCNQGHHRGVRWFFAVAGGFWLGLMAAAFVAADRIVSGAAKPTPTAAPEGDR